MVYKSYFLIDTGGFGYRYQNCDNKAHKCSNYNGRINSKFDDYSIYYKGGYVYIQGLNNICKVIKDLYHGL